MSDSRRKLLAGLASFLAAGALIGGIYGRPDWGLLVAALLALGWQVRQMLSFESALRSGNFDDIRYGEGFWAAAFSQFNKLKNRGSKHKKRYRRLLREVRDSTNAMPDGGIILDDRYEIVLCNTAAQKLVGFDPRKDRGQRVDNILRDPAFVEYLRDENSSAESIEIPSPVRGDHWLYCRIVPYGENQRLLMIRDITERRRLTRMRRDFVANASHELRSPLTVISGYLDALTTDANAPEEWQRPLSQMQSQANRMGDIVAELIELSRLETSGSAPIDGDVDVAGLMTRVRKAFEDREDAPEISTNCRTDLRIRGSGTDIESVITNLVSNAVRHTEKEGRVTIRWEAVNDEAVLSVTDTGEGIPEQYISRLTERFFRVDRGRARSDGGIGLGLAIVKYALGRHDAELRIESAPGEGSTFSCVFPDHRLLRPESLQVAATP